MPGAEITYSKNVQPGRHTARRTRLSWIDVIRRPTYPRLNAVVLFRRFLIGIERRTDSVSLIGRWVMPVVHQPQPAETPQVEA